MKIPFQDYSYLNKRLKKELLIEINQILNSPDNSSHRVYTEEFEKEFADYCNTRFAIGVDSGTTALQLALAASGIKQGDEVIIPAYTYIATALAVSNLGAKPIFADIKEEDLTIDPSLIEKRITNKTKAVIPVHMHGNPCDMDVILDICNNHNLKLIEDASQAHGASYKKKKIGSFGIGCFSLHTSKTLGGTGDAGIITLDNEEIWKKIRQLRVPDNNSKNILLSKRTPCDIDAIQAAIIKVKLPYLDKFNKRKNEIAALYDSFLDYTKIKKITPCENSYPVYRDYCIKTTNLEKLNQFLFNNRIKTKVRYKIPLHLTKTFSYLGYKVNDCPIAEKAAKEVLCLPSFIGITNEEIKSVCECINRFEASKKSDVSKLKS